MRNFSRPLGGGSGGGGGGGVSPPPRPREQLGRSRQPTNLEKGEPTEVGEHSGVTGDCGVAAAGLGPHSPPRVLTSLGRGLGGASSLPPARLRNKALGMVCRNRKRIKLMVERLAMLGVGCLLAGVGEGGRGRGVVSLCFVSALVPSPAQKNKSHPFRET